MKSITLACHTLKELIRKKDFYVLLFLFFALIVFFYNATFFGVRDISRYLKDIGFSVITLFSMIITISISARQVPSEIDSKTIYPMLAKPISRKEFLIGKYLGSLFISIVSFTVFYALYLIVVASKGEGASIVLVSEGYLFSCLMLSVVSAITLFLSLFLTVSANITIMFLLYFFIYWYNGMLKDLVLCSPLKISYLYGFIYYLLPHFEFYDMRIRLVHLWDPLPLWVVASVTLYTAIYVSLVIAFAVKAFNKKDL